jgi:hypothetical protein
LYNRRRLNSCIASPELVKASSPRHYARLTNEEDAAKSRSHANITAAVIQLAREDLLQDFGDTAVQVIDDYLTDGADDSIFVEPEFQKTHYLNAFLKAEKLAKSDEFSPNLRTQLALSRRIFRKGEHMPAINTALSELE